MKTLLARAALILGISFLIAPGSELSAAEDNVYYGTGGEVGRSDRVGENVSGGRLAMAAKSYDRAIIYFTLALQAGASGNAAADIYFRRAEAYFEKGQSTEAAADYKRALQINPKNATDYLDRGSTHANLGNYKLAAVDYAKAAELSRNDADVLNAIAWLKATCPDASQRSAQEALQAATRACELTRSWDGGIIDTLAAAYAEAGRFDDAVKYQEQAIKKTERSERQDLEEHLACYRVRKAYRTKPVLAGC